VYVETLPQCGQGTVAFKLDIKTPKLIFQIKLLKRKKEFGNTNAAEEINLWKVITNPEFHSITLQTTKKCVTVTAMPCEQG
jgi:hypothetical protein